MIQVRTPAGGTALRVVEDGATWVCSVCGSISVWTDDHQWYGALADIDGGTTGRRSARPIVVTCTDLCRDRAVQLGMTDG